MRFCSSRSLASLASSLSLKAETLAIAGDAQTGALPELLYVLPARILPSWLELEDAFAFSLEIEGPEIVVDAEAPTPEDEPLLNDIRGLLFISLTLVLSLVSDTLSFLLSSILS